MNKTNINFLNVHKSVTKKKIDFLRKRYPHIYTWFSPMLPEFFCQIQLWIYYYNFFFVNDKNKKVGMNYWTNFIYGNWISSEIVWFLCKLVFISFSADHWSVESKAGGRDWVWRTIQSNTRNTDTHLISSLIYWRCPFVIRNNVSNIRRNGDESKEKGI